MSRLRGRFTVTSVVARMKKRELLKQVASGLLNGNEKGTGTANGASPFDSAQDRNRTCTVLLPLGPQEYAKTGLFKIKPPIL